MPGPDSRPLARQGRLVDPYASLRAQSLRTRGPEPATRDPAPGSWAARAGDLQGRLEQAESGPGALWESGPGAALAPVAALGLPLRGGPLPEEWDPLRAALDRFVGGLASLGRKRADWALVLRSGDGFLIGLEALLADHDPSPAPSHAPRPDRPLRWDALELSCASIVLRMRSLSFSLPRLSPSARETERQVAAQQVGAQLAGIAGAFGALCQGRAQIAWALSALRAAQVRHRLLLGADGAAERDALDRRFALAAAWADRAIAAWAARMDRMEADLLAIQASESVRWPSRPPRPER